MTMKASKLLKRTLFRSDFFHFNNCSNGVIYEKTRITNKQLDINTLYSLDKYARYAIIKEY